MEKDHNAEQALDLLKSYCSRGPSHHASSSDNASLKSFASSSLTIVDSSPISPSDDKPPYLNFEIPYHATESPALLRPHWRKTPLSIRDLSSLLWRLLGPLIHALTPSFFHPQPPRKIHPTSYLDGLRGLAALIVLIDHFTIHWFESLKYGYLSSPTQTCILQLPVLRLLFAGRASVGVFFVISGFVLSYKPILLLRSNCTNSKNGNSQAQAVIVLASSVFRRSMRLYLPIIVGTFISALLAWKGWYAPVPSRTETIPPMFLAISEQLYDWGGTILDIVYPFRLVDPNEPYSPPYNGHLWTIPIEFFGSTGVFVVLLGLSGVKSGARMVVVGGLAVWGMKRQRWDLFLFLSGTFLAELNFVNHPSLTESQTSHLPYINPAPTTEEPTEIKFATPTKTNVPNLPLPIRILRLPFSAIYTLPRHPTLNTLFNTILLLISLYTLSYPGDSPVPSTPIPILNPNFPFPFPSPPTSQPGPFFAPLAHLTPATYLPDLLWSPHERFWISIGSVLLIYTLSYSPRSQRLLCTSFPQYLGDISYSLYLIHGLVLFTLGTNLMERWTGAVGHMEINEFGTEVMMDGVVGVDNTQYVKAFLMSGVICGVGAVWASDVFWRVVDKRAVEMVRWAERWAGRRS